MRVATLSIAVMTAVISAIPSITYAESGYSATMDGLQEVGPNASPGTGSATVVLNNAEDMIHVHVEFTGLTSTATMAHLHGAAGPGVNAGVQIGLTGFPAATSATYDADFPITAAQVAMLQAGLMYINVHTSTFPGGEIRGQLTSDPTPVEPATWGSVKTLYR